MSCECCKQLLAAMRDQNLVTHRRVFEKLVDVAADATEARETIQLQAGPHTRAWAIRLAAFPTLDDDEATDALAVFNFDSAQAPTEEFTSLRLLAGDFIEPGAKHSHVVPVGVASVHVDIAGVSLTDLATGAAVKVLVQAWELTPNDLRECPTER